MKIQKQSAIDYLRKRGYKTGYKEPYSITENGLVEFMRDFAQEQINLLTQKNELVKADVMPSVCKRCNGTGTIPVINGFLFENCPECKHTEA